MESRPEDILPLGLKQSLESGECVLFVGAGIGSHLKGPDGKPSPDATMLAKELADKFSIATSNYNLSKVAQIVQNRNGRSELESFLQKRLAKLEPDEKIRWLLSQRWKAIYTTNYDNAIERAFDLNSSPLQKPITIASSAELVEFDSRFEVPVYHLHGALFGTSKPHILITEEDYIRFREPRRMLFEILRREFATSSILYIGYSNSDPNWKVVLDETRAEFYPSQLPTSYRVVRETDSLDKELLRSQGVETIDSTIEEFVNVVSSSLAETTVDPDRIKRLKSKTPTALLPAFEKNPAATSRLLSCWIYVNQAPFDDKPNIESFLRGDRANWALIGKRMFFERDVEEQAFDSLLDFATSASKRPKVISILGPAGYGISTLLMCLAGRLVRENAGPVFMHIPNTPVREGDIEFAQSIFPQRPFFIIDNASDNIEIIRTALQTFADSGRAACFLLGERLNEWRQAGWKVKGEEHIIDPLTDPEINRLLKFLEDNNALGELRDLEEGLRIAAIKEKHGKELLVTMRETTEGASFDAILEDEYLGIKNLRSRELYLTVACFHQHDALARDTILADLLKLSVEEMYALCSGSTEGVVIFDCVDESYGHYAARTRHRIIAQVIWERCGSGANRDRLVLSVLGAINLSYRLDREAFDQLIRSDRLVDGIHTFEGKTQFFETAVKKDPENPYVLQHYARMLLREKKSDLALGQISLALKLNSSSRVLHHTKAVILRNLALETPSVEIARKRLVQSEEEFRRCIAIHNRDEYSFQGLAELYLGWAKRAQTPEEQTAYIGKAEEVIEEGLRQAKVRDGLWVVSADVQRWLGDQPGHIQALEKAFAENPGSIIAPYLLGRAYRKAGKTLQARDVLHKLVTNNPNAFRPCVEYAYVLWESGEPYSKAIAVLRLSSLYGLSDPRFVATLGGMLFMSEQFTDANDVFEESIKHEFPAIEARRINFRPCDPLNRNNPLRLSGSIVTVRSGYALIQVPGYPNFPCPASKFGGLYLKPGLKVTFEPVFSARGPLADSLLQA